MNARAELADMFAWWRDPRKRVVFGLTLLVLATLPGVRYNGSGSVPVGFWYETMQIGPVARGETIAICPPPQAAAIGLARGYLQRSPMCSSGVMPLAKVVVAVAGDTVRVTGAGLTVDGVRIDGSGRLARDPSNRPMLAIPPGTYEVAPGTVWVLGSEPRSFDSRYYGAVSLRGQAGQLFPLALTGSTREQTARYESLVATSHEL
jgi:conjugative transfer signal peptidase TraF